MFPAGEGHGQEIGPFRFLRRRLVPTLTVGRPYFRPGRVTAAGSIRFGFCAGGLLRILGLFRVPNLFRLLSLPRYEAVVSIFRELVPYCPTAPFLVRHHVGVEPRRRIEQFSMNKIIGATEDGPNLPPIVVEVSRGHMDPHTGSESGRQPAGRAPRSRAPHAHGIDMPGGGEESRPARMLRPGGPASGKFGVHPMLRPAQPAPLR